MQKSNNSALSNDITIGSGEREAQTKSKNLVLVKNSELTIWKNLIKGEETALGELYNLYIDVLYLYGMQNSKDKGYVMDCIHDLFVDLYKYKKNLSMTDNVKYYLFRSLKRKINKKYNSKTILVSEEYQYSINTANKNYTKSHEEQIIKNERTTEKHDKLENALCTLTKKQKEGLFLRYEQQKSYEEISIIMGISAQSARTTTFRAIKALRKLGIKY